MQDTVRKLKSLDIFQSVAEKNLKEMASKFEIIYIQRREVLFEAGQPINIIYLILYGSFKIQKSFRDSDPVIFNFLGSGQLLGVAIADSAKSTYPATAVANEDSAVLLCSREFFYDSLFQIPSIRAAVNQQIRERFLEFQNDRGMQNVRIPQRIADFLLRLHDRQRKEHGIQIMIPITRKDIAQRLSTHTETVIRILSEWDRKGWIETINRRIVIHNISKLMEIRDEKCHKDFKNSASNDFKDVGST